MIPKMLWMMPRKFLVQFVLIVNTKRICHYRHFQMCRSFDLGNFVLFPGEYNEMKSSVPSVINLVGAMEVEKLILVFSNDHCLKL